MLHFNLLLYNRPAFRDSLADQLPVDKTTLKNITVFSHSTIGKLEPSYVIRKFLDAQRIHNLTAYLQALHRQSLANADHTTLLLNCYTKLKDSSKLEEFIKVTDQ